MILVQLQYITITIIFHYELRAYNIKYAIRGHVDFIPYYNVRTLFSCLTDDNNYYYDVIQPFHCCNDTTIIVIKQSN